MSKEIKTTLPQAKSGAVGAYIGAGDDESLAKRNHVFRGHMELETVKEFIKANNSDSLQNIILCHLSNDNANPEECKAEVEKVAKCPVYVAMKGLEVEFRNGNECPF